MIRYNIHLNPEWMKTLEEIRISMIDKRGNSWGISCITRADMIRLAVASYYDLPTPFSHDYSGDAEKIIKQILRKRKKAQKGGNRRTS